MTHPYPDADTYTISKVPGEPNNFTDESYTGISFFDPEVGKTFQVMDVEGVDAGSTVYGTRTSTVVDIDVLEEGRKWRLHTKSGSVYMVEKEVE